METYKCPFLQSKYAVYHHDGDYYTLTCECGSIRLPSEAWRKYRAKYCTSLNGWRSCSMAEALNGWYEEKS